mgnify:CR=1 FL=1
MILTYKVVMIWPLQSGSWTVEFLALLTNLESPKISRSDHALQIFWKDLLFEKSREMLPILHDLETRKL